MRFAHFMLGWNARICIILIAYSVLGPVSLAQSLSNICPGARLPRALPDAPNGYTPDLVQCPVSEPFVRYSVNISIHEMDWLQKRQEKRLKAMNAFLTRIKVPGFNASHYFAETPTQSLPNIGIAFSGGGYRALLNGAGIFAAFDERTPGSTTPGHLGGLIQSSTYLSGLSGGSWLVGSIYVNNFTTVTALLDSHTSGLWEFGQSVLSGPTGDAGYLNRLRQVVDGKEEAGFPVSITDYWYYLLPCILSLLANYRVR